MNAELFKKICPKAFYGKFLESDIRPDGRDMNDGRGLIVAPGHIGSADGSSFVRIGMTGIICGLKLEYIDAGEITQTSGNLDVRVIMTPLSNPKFFLGKPTNQAVFYAETLRRIFEKYVIDVGELYVPEMKKMICLHADLLCIDYEGSVLDACCIALLAALMTLKIPTAILKDDTAVFDYDHPRFLTILDIPVSVTFGFFDDFEVMDPDVFEEQLVEDTVSVVMGRNARVLSIVKPGGKSIPEKTLEEITTKVKERYAFVYEQVDAFRNSLSTEMNTE
ncbi:hypothetical protein WA577_001500 [Blastocystis sp. JDR]